MFSYTKRTDLSGHWFCRC